MSKFKAGDKIRFLGSGYVMRDFKVGHEYVVGGSYHGRREGSVGVVCDESGEENGYPEEFFKLVSPAETTQEAGPVRTVTRKEIVPGTYGCVRIIAKPTNDPFPQCVHVRVDDGQQNATELRAAASVFISLAEALEQDG